MITTQQLVAGVGTSAGPAAVVAGDSYVLAWKGEGTDTGLYWTSGPTTDGGAPLDAYHWSPQQRIANVGTSAGPALAVFKDKIYLVWKGEGTDQRLFLSVHDALPSTTPWAAQVVVPGVGGTSAAPALAATADALYLAWKAEPGDDRIFWSKSTNGTTWAAQQPVAGVGGTSDAPALAAQGTTVYLAWKAEPGDDRIFWSKSTNGTTWAAQQPVAGVGGTSTGPALATDSAGKVYLAWKAEPGDNRIFTNQLGSSGGTTQHAIAVVLTDDRPALASQPAGSSAPVLLAWKGGSDSALWVGPLLELAAQPVKAPAPLPSTLTFSAPVTGFGSGPTSANFSATVTLRSNGEATFSGQYTDSGSIPIFSAPAQDYEVVFVVASSNNKVFTFSHGKNDVPTGGAQDTWGPTQPVDEVVPSVTNAQIAANWAELVVNKYATFRCSNSTDLGSFLDSVVSDVEQLIDDAEEVVEVVTVIASALS